MAITGTLAVALATCAFQVPYRRVRLGRDVEVRVYDTLESERPEGVVLARHGEAEDERTMVGTPREADAIAAAVRDGIARHRAPSGYRA